MSMTYEYLEEVKRMIDIIHDQVDPFIDELYQAYLENRTIFLIGNGGSASSASHFGQDLNKGTLPHIKVRKRFRAIPLTDNVSFITALANDIGYEFVFVEQLCTLSQPDDLLIAISGSGNSPNILRTVEYANEQKIRTIGVTGFDGGQLRKISHTNIHIPSNNMGLIEAVHSVVFHLVVHQISYRIVSELGTIELR